MAELRWTEEAVTWLEDIYAYIALDNPVAAASVVEGIYKKAQILLSHPGVGFRYREEREGEIRILLYGHYRIAYLRRGEGDIDILWVFHVPEGGRVLNCELSIERAVWRLIHNSRHDPRRSSKVLCGISTNGCDANYAAICGSNGVEAVTGNCVGAE